ncbi:MAG: Xaa-Pro peptidase family protein [Candidatus Bathyarchaeia archaeon]
MKRIDRLRMAFLEKGLDGFAVFNWANLLYLTGTSSAAALVIPQDGECTVYAYGVNYEQAKAEAKEFSVELIKREEKLMTKVADKTKICGMKNLAVDALGVDDWRALAKLVKGSVKLKVAGQLLWRLRKVKDAEEIALMRRAAELTSEGMKVAYEVLAPGIHEYELAAEVEYAMRKRGSNGTAFETIVASGASSAFPHGSYGEKLIREGDLVVVDVGATFKFYRSDMTRTLVVGVPSEKQKRLYELVRRAHDRAFEAIKANAKAKEIDAAARTIIENAGYGEFFVHGLGHGVGLEVHEPPMLNPSSADVLVAGNVVTDEPGIYLAGYGGVRIEDTVLVNETGAEKLTSAAYELSVK